MGLTKHRFLILLSLAILISSYAQYGAFYKPVESRYYSYVHTERSLEYRNEMRLHQEIVKELKKDRYRNMSIGAPFMTAHTLAYPQLGYVDEPFPVIIYGMTLTYPGIQNFQGLTKEGLLNTIWIGFKSNFPQDIPYPITPNDQILKEIVYGDKKATLFRGGFAIDHLYRSVLQQTQ